MKNFFLDDKIYDIKEYNAGIHKNIRCEDEDCRVPIVYISNRIQPYFRVKHGLKHEDNCSVFKKSPRKGEGGIKRNKINPNKGLICWAFGEKTETNIELIEEYKKKKKQRKKRRMKNIF